MAPQGLNACKTWPYRAGGQVANNPITTNWKDVGAFENVISVKQSGCVFETHHLGFIDKKENQCTHRAVSTGTMQFLPNINTPFYAQWTESTGSQPFG